jgi:integrase
MLEVDELQQLIDSCKNTRDKAIISVMYDGAFRLGEFVNMTIGDIIKDEQGRVGIIVDGKTGQGVGWLNSSVAYLDNYLKTHPNKNNKDAPLWITQYNKKFSYTGLQQLIYLIAGKSPITKNISCHTLRHSRIRYLKNKGMPEAHLRQFARWSKDSVMPSVYGAIDGDDAKRELFKIDKPQKVYTKQEVDKEVNKQVTDLRSEMKIIVEFLKQEIASTRQMDERYLSLLDKMG